MAEATGGLRLPGASGLCSILGDYSIAPVIGRKLCCLLLYDFIEATAADLEDYSQLFGGFAGARARTSCHRLVKVQRCMSHMSFSILFVEMARGKAVT
eukprot:6209072-Pleurochrysis_carterae.AAC.1